MACCSAFVSSEETHQASVGTTDPSIHGSAVAHKVDGRLTFEVQHSFHHMYMVHGCNTLSPIQIYLFHIVVMDMRFLESDGSLNILDNRQ